MAGEKPRSTGEGLAARRGTPPLPERGGRSPGAEEQVTAIGLENEAVGEALPPGRAPTGPAKPRRSVCAPAAMALSLYRRPVSQRRSIMGFSSWLRKPRSNRAPRGPAHHRPLAPRCRPRLEELEGRCLLSGGVLDPSFDT